VDGGTRENEETGKGKEIVGEFLSPFSDVPVNGLS
jgi:hypothetical protein